MSKYFNDYNSYLRKIYNCRVQKISLDAGLTCPNRDGSIASDGCIYCNEKGSGTGLFTKRDSITEQLITGKKYISKRYKANKFIAYFQSFSNTYAPFNKLQELYSEALSFDGVVGLSIGTRPDCIDSNIINLLQTYARQYLIWIEYGLQSSNDQTLKKIDRGHDCQTFIDAVKMTQNRGINICAHVILGLPGENRSHMMETAKFIADLGLDGVKLHLLYVIKNTKLDHLYQQGYYQCLGQNEYAELVCDFIERLPKNMIIQRITSDPHADELIAPEWALKRNENIALIHSIFEQRNSWQGKFYNSLTNSFSI